MSPASAASPKTRTSAASKVRMNSRPMILRFSSGSTIPSSAPRNCSLASTTSSLSKTASKSERDLLGLAEPHHPVVDVDAGQPVADRALHDRGGDRGVDAAGQRADRAAVADLLADRLDLLLDDVEHRPGLPAAGDVVQEVLEHLLAVLGVQHLRVPLDAGQPARDVLERRHRRARRRGQHGEPLRRLRHRVAVRHPDVVVDGYVGQEGPGLPRPRPGCGRTRGPRCAPPRRPAPAPSAGTRSTCRTPGCRP